MALDPRYKPILIAILAALGGCFASGPAPGESVSTSVSVPSAQLEQRAIEQIQRFGTTSFRNAGMPASEWRDSTQQLVVELLERLPRRDLASPLPQQPSETRQELNRAVWRIVKRWKRQRRHQSLFVEEAYQQSAHDNRRRNRWTLKDLEQLPDTLLTERQTSILRRLSEGESPQQIATALNLDPPQVSREKYLAIHKLRRAWLRSQQV
ncbi:hypothetical protein FF011L_51250 [Roseimaritima multifibrata]|uniref:Uncharacterized protein n=1 Tax=Roseimaritima multifibrata TaxID=1930274 RepID=A0A517MNF9_9BACT|nr:sigma-70 family RNA polymerase sigma factor [Roseimaritima multifibrata]QDS96317.1 hypothetical protein FF011L_51250 [Roseimaritima multifibrata]